MKLLGTAILTLATLGVISAALGQSNAVKPTYLPPPALQPMAVKPAPLARSSDTVIIRHGQGGKLADHRQRFADYRDTKVRVELRGPCYSACTLITAYVAKADLCIAEGAFFAFHAVRSMERQELMRGATATMYWQQTEQIRSWIDRMGGWENLPLNGYWTMYDRDLWAMGYPRCAP